MEKYRKNIPQEYVDFTKSMLFLKVMLLKYETLAVCLEY